MPETVPSAPRFTQRPVSRIPGVTRQLLTRVSAETATVSVLEAYHLRDRPVGVTRLLYSRIFPIDQWQTDPGGCCRQALSLIHPALGDARAGDGH